MGFVGPAHGVLRETRWAGEIVEFAEIFEALKISRNRLRRVVRHIERNGEQALARQEMAHCVFEVGGGLQLLVEVRERLQRREFDVSLVLDFFGRDGARPFLLRTFRATDRANRDRARRF